MPRRWKSLLYASLSTLLRSWASVGLSAFAAGIARPAELALTPGGESPRRTCISRSCRSPSGIAGIADSPRIVRAGMARVATSPVIARPAGIAASLVIVRPAGIAGSSISAASAASAAIGYLAEIVVPGIARFPAFAVLVGGLAACRPQPAPPLPSPPEVALEVDFAGCASVRRGPLCALDEGRRLRLWLPRPRVVPSDPIGPGERCCAITCLTDGGPVTCEERESSDQGRAYEVVLSAGATRLTIEEPQAPSAAPALSSDNTRRSRSPSRSPSPTPISRFRLRLTAHTPDPELDAADRLRRRDLEAADHQLAALQAREPDPDRRARAEALRARIALARGQSERAQAGLRDTFAAATHAGRISDAAHDGFALAHVLITDQLRLEEGRALLATIEPLLRDFPEGRAELAYYTALLGAQSGDVRAALASFRHAAQYAAHLGQRALEGYAETQLAVELAALGRTQEALTLGQAAVRRSQARGRDPAELPCNRAAPAVDLAWIALLAWRGRGLGASVAQPTTPGRTRSRPNPDPDPEHARLSDPGPLLAAARAAMQTEGCEDLSRWQNARLNEALFAIACGDARQARAHLDGRGHSEVAALPSYLAVWEAEARGRLALIERRPPDARAAFSREALLSRTAGLIDGVLRAETGLGRALLAEGQKASAIQHLRAAHAAFEALFDLVPLGEGRDAFMQSHEESARFLVDALARVGQAKEAFTIARLDRARALAAVTQSRRLATLAPAQRARWDHALAAYRAERAALEADARRDVELPRDALVRAQAARLVREQAARTHLDEAYQILRGGPSPSRSAALAWPRPGEVYLGHAPGDQGWWAFLATTSGVKSAHLGDLDGLAAAPAPEQARRLFGPFAGALASANRVRLFPHPALDDLDLHALPLRPADGQRLDATRAVDYGVDLPTPSSRTTTLTGAFLVVSDPTEDLPATREEARDVSAAFLAARPSARPSLGPYPGASGLRRLEASEATRDKVLTALPGAAVFHFAGHASYAGTEGFDSALPLAGGTTLTVGDVLALPRVPEVIALAACEAAGHAGGPLAATLPLGIAEAFLAAGARVVVAPTRPVDDALASAYMKALYGALVTTEYWLDPAFSFVHAAGVADEVIRRTMPNAHGSPFRVLAVPTP